MPVIFGLPSPKYDIYLDPLKIRILSPVKLVRRRLLITAIGELLGYLNKWAYMIITDLASYNYKQLHALSIYDAFPNNNVNSHELSKSLNVLIYRHGPEVHIMPVSRLSLATSISSIFRFYS